MRRRSHDHVTLAAPLTSFLIGEKPSLLECVVPRESYIDLCGRYMQYMTERQIYAVHDRTPETLESAYLVFCDRKFALHSTQLIIVPVQMEEGLCYSRVLIMQIVHSYRSNQPNNAHCQISCPSDTQYRTCR